MSSRTGQSVSSLMWPTRHLDWRRTWRLRQLHTTAPSSPPPDFVTACLWRPPSASPRRATSICFRNQRPRLQQAGHRAASRPWPRARPGLREGEPRRRPAMVDWSSLVKRPPTPTSRQSTVRARVLHMTSRRARPASPSVPFASMPGQMQDGKERLPSANEEGPKGVEARDSLSSAGGPPARRGTARYQALTVFVYLRCRRADGISNTVHPCLLNAVRLDMCGPDWRIRGHPHHKSVCPAGARPGSRCPRRWSGGSAAREKRQLARFDSPATAASGGAIAAMQATPPAIPRNSHVHAAATLVSRAPVPAP